MNEKHELFDETEELRRENEQLKQEIKQYWKCRDKWKQEAKELKEENEQLKAKVNDLSNMELEERDIVCGAGRFRLEEWGKHRFHQFYDDDTPLEDETVVIRLMELSNEVEQLRRYVYHCPQTCNKILKYLSKSETEDLKAVNGAFDDDKYFDEEIDTLRSWER